MLKLTREYQTWTASFSNGFLFNEEARGSSEISALQTLARQFIAHRKQTPVIRKMVKAINGVALALLEGRPRPQLYGVGINLAEY